ncbi:MAG: TIGR04104 family putative zinc finger protein [Bacillota bacterium]
MPHCENCGTKWSWSDTLKIGFKNNRKCPSCGERQYVVPNFSTKTYALYLLPLLTLIVLNIFFEFPLGVYIALAAPYILIVIALIPYTIKLSSEQKPLW